MCGIVGLTDINNFHLLDKMNDLINHRGPDSAGKLIDEEHSFAFAMRRLSIIDIDSGSQPISNEDGSIWVICNGEIYNSPILREKLIEKGHVFKTKNSDVEVLIHLYEEKGIDFLQELNGMFAFVIFDKKRKKCFGVRDRIGIKPFYYTVKNLKFAFASEIKSLLILPWVSKEINMESLYHYISLQFIPSPKSIFKDVRKLKPGYYCEYNLAAKTFSEKKYWGLNVNNIKEYSDSYELRENVKHKLIGSVKKWSLSDVPISCSLSGGLDSSALVGILASYKNNKVKTYSLGFEEEDVNELKLARKVSQKWNTNHIEYILNAENIINDLDTMVWHLDEPYGGGLPSWYVYKLIGKDVKVALTGTGGDELFGNYGKYSIYEKSFIYRYLRNIRDSVRFKNFKNFQDSFRNKIGHFYQMYFTDAVKDKYIFNDSSECVFSTEKMIENLWKESNSKNSRNAVAYVDFNLQLPEEFLHVTDRFSMAHSVEARVPLLDHELVELVFTLDPIIRTGNTTPKTFFRELIKDYIPKELYNAPKKGFILPLNKWTRNQLRPIIEKYLNPKFLKNQGVLNEKIYNNIILPHMNGKNYLTEQVWTLFMFQLWYNKFIGN